MSESEEAQAWVRQIFGTESSWCKAVPGGTGITVLALLTNKQPDICFLENSLHKLQTIHPILKSKLQFNPISTTFSLLIPPSPALHLNQFDIHSTAQIVQQQDPHLTPFQNILEHELNLNTWEDSSSDADVFHATVYALHQKWVLVLRVHTGTCDRTAAVAVLRELLQLMSAGDGGLHQQLQVEEEDVKMGIEEYIPPEKTNKPFWSRGVDMLGYSFNSFRLTNFDFVGPSSPRCSRVLRLVLDSHHTTKLLQGCKRRDTKLCGVLSAAGLMAARLCKGIAEGKWEKYAVVTLTDCRKHLEPPLSSHHVGKP